jgi:hypothetical protein
MITERLIKIIEKSGDELTQRLIQDLNAREETRHIRTQRQNRVYSQVYEVYSELNSWLSGGKTKGKIIDHYMELGRQRYNEGIALSEVIMVLLLIKRHLWFFAIEKKVIDPSDTVQDVLELNNRVVLFFDRIIYTVSVGYEREQKENSVL